MNEPSSSTTARLPRGTWWRARVSRGTARKVNWPRTRMWWASSVSRWVIRVRVSRCRATPTATAMPRATPSSTPKRTTPSVVTM